jgi:hypothetical protein
MYPAEVSDVFEKYLDCLLNLSGHPDFVNESSFSHDCMSRFSAALSTMNLDGFQPFVAAEASYTEVQIAGDASISRLRPIKDDIDFWGDRSSPSTDTGPSEPQ